ncbi:hypothetical protein [Lacisediminihabitans profunda]|uniref:Uncharacterized protein n=1 Tax=Lacisediminihabitans profunda TaxID=2594790 RepID=A0A5C8UPF4_9MICO|nr:hypothetical protein [Lacisediminihabitans profunda]TXN29761.1 hypothetical protein FVP33_11465 [Lacisediminihabitans profunda]
MTIMFGLAESVVAPLVRAIAGAELTTSEVEDCFARASWTGIAEPGDRTAGELVAALGAATALTTVVEHWSVERTGKPSRRPGRPFRSRRSRRRPTAGCRG